MDGDFSDEEWDIPDEQLKRLEDHAVVSTQQQRSAPPVNGRKGQTVRLNSIQRDNTERLDTTAIQQAISKVGNNSPRPVQFPQAGFASPQIDEDDVPLVVEEQEQSYVPRRRFDEQSAREQHRLNRFAEKQQPKPVARQIPHQAYQNYQQNQGLSSPITQQNGSQHDKSAGQAVNAAQSAKPNGSTAVDSELREILAQLRRENELLAQNLDAANRQLQTAHGEIVNIRKKNTEDARSTDRQLVVLKKQMQEEVQKQKMMLQAKDANLKTLSTENELSKHELQEETRKVQMLQKQLREQPLRDKAPDINTTPRKLQKNSLRDGFDDTDLMFVSPGRSPSKSIRKSKPGTPTNRKRKQSSTNDMPPLTLRFSQNHEPEPEVKTVISAPLPIVVKDTKTERHLRFLQDLLNYCPNQCKNIIEELASFRFPPENELPLSSFVLNGVADLKGGCLPRDVLNNIFVTLLVRCTKEKYYEPVSLILSTIQYILTLDPTIVNSEVLNNTLPCVQELADINARRLWLVNDRNKTWDENNPKPRSEPNVSTSLCLKVLSMLAGLVSDEPDLIQLFWQSITTEFVLLLLTPVQRLQDKILMLQLLSTSILPDTFGNIVKSKDEQALIETYTIDKVSFLLHEKWKPGASIRVMAGQPPRPPVAESIVHSPHLKNKEELPESDLAEPEVITRVQMCGLKLAAVDLLSQFILTPSPARPSTASPTHGLLAVLRHVNAIARLTGALYFEIKALCSMTSNTQYEHARLVNQITRLLHHILLSKPATQVTPGQNAFELPKALVGIATGVHKFRVAMTRVAFWTDESDTVMEELKASGAKDSSHVGITEDTKMYAMELLEDYVTPDEAVQLLEAFGRNNSDETEAEEEAQAAQEAMDVDEGEA